MFEPIHAQPKHEQVRRYLLDQIRDHRLEPGTRLPSEAKLGELLGVSRLTVRRAITTLVTDGVLRSEAGVGHVVRATAPSARIGILFNAGAFIYSESSRYVTGFPFLLFHALNRRLRQRGCHVSAYMPLLPADEDDANLGLEIEEHPLMIEVRRRRLSGLVGIYWPPIHSARPRQQQFSHQLESLLREQEVPWVSVIGRVWSNAVTVDMEAMIDQAIRTLKQQGATRLGLLTCGRIAGDYQALFTRTAQSLGLHVQEPWLGNAANHTEAQGHQWFTQLWDQPQRPDAVVITDDVLARGAMIAAVQRGVQIPGDVQFAHLWIRRSEQLLPCPSIRMEVDPDEMADAAVDKLLNLIDDANYLATRTMVRPRITVAHSLDDLTTEPFQA